MKTSCRTKALALIKMTARKLLKKICCDVHMMLCNFHAIITIYKKVHSKFKWHNNDFNSCNNNCVLLYTENAAMIMRWVFLKCITANFFSIDCYANVNANEKACITKFNLFCESNKSQKCFVFWVYLQTFKALGFI